MPQHNMVSRLTVMTVAINDNYATTADAISTCCITRMHKRVYLTIFTFILLIASLATIFAISFISDTNIGGFFKLVISVIPICIGVGSVIIIAFAIDHFKKRHTLGASSMKIELSNFIVRYIHYYDRDCDNTTDVKI